MTLVLVFLLTVRSLLICVVFGSSLSVSWS